MNDGLVQQAQYVSIPIPPPTYLVGKRMRIHRVDHEQPHGDPDTGAEEGDNQLQTKRTSHTLHVTHIFLDFR